MTRRSRNHGTHMITSHPHTTHRTQPLDVAVSSPFKRRLRTEFNCWLTQNPGHTITIAKLTGKPVIESFTESNIKSGFRKAGIYPLNCGVFRDKDFKGANVTDRPLSSEEQATDQNPMPSTSSNLQSTIQTLSSNVLPGVQTTNKIIVISDAPLAVKGPSTPQ